ncbi:hypothetical protein FO519_003115 [Halicephalobus sp. NKZ332]|nr:hypothetical protein FO519_003115 [Halicephalobus sp. NKZ332]
MQSIAFSGAVLIDESKGSSGRPLWISSVMRACKLGFDVKVLLFVEIEEDLKEILNGHNPSYVDCVRGYRSVEELSEFMFFIRDEMNRSKSLLVIDCLTALIRRFGVDEIANIIRSISECCPVLTRFERDELKELERTRLASIASTTLVVKKSEDGKVQLCNTITVKKDGSLREKIESYEINPETGILTSRSIKQEAQQQSKQKEEPKSDFAPCHAGNLNRIKKEKASVVLPFTRAQKQEGLVGLNANRKTLGAKIEYFADKDDDLDDSDPDEELMY